MSSGMGELSIDMVNNSLKRSESEITITPHVPSITADNIMPSTPPGFATPIPPAPPISPAPPAPPIPPTPSITSTSDITPPPATSQVCLLY
jgi:hypothetical protein